MCIRWRRRRPRDCVLRPHAETGMEALQAVHQQRHPGGHRGRQVGHVRPAGFTQIQSPFAHPLRQGTYNRQQMALRVLFTFCRLHRWRNWASLRPGLTAVSRRRRDLRQRPTTLRPLQQLSNSSNKRRRQQLLRPPRPLSTPLIRITLRLRRPPWLLLWPQRPCRWWSANAGPSSRWPEAAAVTRPWPQRQPLRPPPSRPSPRNATILRSLRSIRLTRLDCWRVAEPLEAEAVDTIQQVKTIRMPTETTTRTSTCATAAKSLRRTWRSARRTIRPHRPAPLPPTTAPEAAAAAAAIIRFKSSR